MFDITLASKLLIVACMNLQTMILLKQLLSSSSANISHSETIINNENGITEMDETVFVSSEQMSLILEFT